MILYGEMEKAFKFYNEKLFGGSLPEVVFSLDDRNGIRGCFSLSTLVNEEGNIIAKISINPSYIKEGEEKKILCTLVHEMCHLKRFMDGERLSNGYHSKKWAQVMKESGLIPTDDGTMDGKETGFAMTQYVEKGGAFDIYTKKLFEKGFSFGVKNSGEVKENEVYRNENSGKRYRYKCGCSSFWGKKNLKVMCRNCGQDFIMEKKED